MLLNNWMTNGNFGQCKWSSTRKIVLILRLCHSLRDSNGAASGCAALVPPTYSKTSLQVANALESDAVTLHFYASPGPREWLLFSSVTEQDSPRISQGSGFGFVLSKVIRDPRFGGVHICTSQFLHRSHKSPKNPCPITSVIRLKSIKQLSAQNNNSCPFSLNHSNVRILPFEGCFQLLLKTCVPAWKRMALCQVSLNLSEMQEMQHDTTHHIYSYMAFLLDSYFCTWPFFPNKRLLARVFWEPHPYFSHGSHCNISCEIFCEQILSQTQK